MALDVQRNWDVSMAENLGRLRLKNRPPPPPTRTDTAQPTSRPPRYPVYLPDEIILQITSYVRLSDQSQRTLYACALLSRQWYAATIPFLYAHPALYGNNYDPFVRAICPSINRHVRKSPLAALVKVLNMGGLVHQGSKSITARVLGRTKDNLEVFVAPQASFAINCFPALAKCRHMRLLDLSLVSEAASLQTLFDTVKGLKALTELHLPRSSGFGGQAFDPRGIVWPPKLEALFLSGGIDGHFLYGVVSLPQTLRSLTVDHCPLAEEHAVQSFIHKISDARIPLRHLKLSHLPRLGEDALDGVLHFLPGLEHLSISVDYVSPEFLQVLPRPGYTDMTGIERHGDELSLQMLDLTNSGFPGADKLTAMDIIIAMDDDEGGQSRLSELRQVGVAKSLEWAGEQCKVEDFDALDDHLKALPWNGVRPGVWVFDG